MSQRKAKRGDLVEISWLDATFTTDMDEHFAETCANGGELLHATGYLCNVFKRSVVICAELDSARNPSRDFNCIPKALITKVKILKRNVFGERRNA